MQTKESNLKQKLLSTSTFSCDSKSSIERIKVPHCAQIS